MPCKPRTRSPGDIYHCFVRGTGRQILFEDDRDRLRFVALLYSLRKECGVEIFAWVLMSNHFHILVHAPIETVSKFMQRLLITYVMSFNRRHDRIGHLTQSRFGSKAIDSDPYLMEVIRYIHQNPLEVPGCTLENYRWSSYREYADNRPWMTTTAFAISVMNTLENFIAYHQTQAETDLNPFPVEVKKMTDDEANAFLKVKYGEVTYRQLPSMAPEQRNVILREIKEAGLPIRQIARLTGIGRNIIQRA